MAQFINEQTGVIVQQENRSVEDLANQGFTPVPVTPVVPEPTVVEPVTPENIETPAVTEVPEPTVVEEPEVVNRAALLENIQGSFDVSPNLQANEAFIQGVAKLATGSAATAEQLGMAGQSIQSIIESFGIGEQINGFAMSEPVEVPGGEESPVVAEEKPEIISIIDSLIEKKQAGLAGAVDTQAFLTKKQDAATAAEISRQAIADKQLVDAETLKGIAEDKPIPLGDIAAQQRAFLADERIDNMKMVQNHNNNVILSQIAQGNFLEAQRINQQIAADNFEIEKLKIERAKQQGIIDATEADLLDQESQIDFARQAEGFIRLTPEQAIDFEDDRLITLPNGKIYLRPIQGTTAEQQLANLKIISEKLGIEEQMMKNQILDDGNFQTTEKLTDGLYRVTYDRNGNIANKIFLGEAPAGSNKASGSQYQAAGFAKRMEHSTAIIDEFEKFGTGGGVFDLTFAAATNLPEWMKTDGRKKFEQAERNFINAQLRRESGAAIAPSEFDSARLQYIPQIGDGESVLKQKRENREMSMQNLINEAGSAWITSDTGGGVSNTEDLFN